MTNQKFVVGIIAGILLTLIVTSLPAATNKSYLGRLVSKIVPTPDPKVLSQTADVLPANYNLGVSFGDVVVKMVSQGAIDKDKFLKRHPEAIKVLGNSDPANIIITSENSALLLNLLWPLGISNKSKVLSEGPMGTQYKGQEGNFASTGGWTLGIREGGKLFNSLSLVNLTAKQEAEVLEIASNIYRPCCGNSTAFPDCNHGAAMLGFIELAVAQGMPKNEIYKKALVLNSYWFPQTYTELAIYFKVKKNIPWKKVKPEEVLGAQYSSGQGYAEINKQLQTDGLLPKVSGGGGCGV